MAMAETGICCGAAMGSRRGRRVVPLQAKGSQEVVATWSGGGKLSNIRGPRQCSLRRLSASSLAAARVLENFYAQQVGHFAIA